MKVKGTVKLFPPDEGVEIPHAVLAQFADYLSPEVRAITVDNDELLTGVSTDPEEDDTFFVGYIPFPELGIMHQDIAPRNLLVDPETEKYFSSILTGPLMESNTYYMVETTCLVLFHTIRDHHKQHTFYEHSLLGSKHRYGTDNRMDLSPITRLRHVKLPRVF